jgi:hypothetical protein
MMKKEGIMRVRLILTAWLLFFGLPGYSSAIPPDELPFGSMYLDTLSYSDTSEVRLLGEDMCFNYFVDYWHYIDTTNIPILYSYGIQAIRGGITGEGQAEPPMKYSNAIYAEIELGYPYPNDEVRMESFADPSADTTAEFVGDVWVSYGGTAGDTLSGISTYAPPDKFTGEPKNQVGFRNLYLFSVPEQGEIDYRIDIDMKINTIGDTSDTVAAVNMEIGVLETCSLHVHPLQSVTAGEFTTADSFHTISRNFDFPDSIIISKRGDCGNYTVIHIPNTGGSPGVYYLTLSIATTGERTVSVDKILISDGYGRDLIEDGDFDNLITQKFEEYAYQDSMIYGWMLMDEPLWPNLLPFKYIDSLMDSVCSDWITFTDNVHYQGYRTMMHSYFDIVGVDFYNPEIYVFGSDDGYAGTDYQGEGDGPLYDFSRHVSWVRERVDNDQKDFWVTMQAMQAIPTPEEYYRLPTGPELSATTFMALAWGCRGIQYWLYDAIRNTNYPIAIRDTSKTPTVLYYQIKDHIGPYIKAIDATYMSLTWDTAYAVHHGTPNVDPPPGAWIDSITAVSNDTLPNPDSGWFHIGQFTEGSDKYVMIVNRACSQGPENPDPAPSITATVKFEPEYLQFGNYVEIIDIADSVDYISYDSILVFAETTYVSVQNGLLTYTTEFGPGEGRLFKIAQAR